MDKKVIKLNLGSGPDGIEGWLNYDWGFLPLVNKLPLLRDGLISMGLLGKEYGVSWPEFRLVDIRKTLPLKDKSVDYIYCSHVLEHFEKWQALAVVKECKRVLKKHGVVRIVLPDVEKVVASYRPGKAGEFCRVWWGFDKDIEPVGLIGKLRRSFIRGHAWMYDQSELKGVLKKAGFQKIYDRKFGSGKTPDLDRLDLAGHKKTSFYVEAEV